MEIREVRKQLNMTQAAFSQYFGIPLRTLQGWEYGQRKVPKYLVDIIIENLRLKGMLD